MMAGTAEVPHQSATAYLLEAASVFDATTALDTTLDMVDPQPTLVELLVRHVLLPRELLPQIEIKSNGQAPLAQRFSPLQQRSSRLHQFPPSRAASPSPAPVRVA
jgi:hypothetical protein